MGAQIGQNYVFGPCMNNVMGNDSVPSYIVAERSQTECTCLGDGETFNA